MATSNKLVVLGITPTSAEDQTRIRAVNPRVEFVDAGGWFEGEIRATWPAFTIERYLHPKAQGKGTQAERDAMLANAEVVLAGWPYPLDIRTRAARLRWFHQRPAGASNLRRGDLWNSNVTVTTSRGYSDSRAIAEYAIAAILHFAKGFHQARNDAQQRAFDPRAYRAAGLAGKVACVVGAGGIGLEVARLCSALGMQVVGTRGHKPKPGAHDPAFTAVGGPEALHEFLPQTDFLIIACQWTPATTNLVSASLFAALKPDAVLINVARGEIVNETDLLAALASGQLRGAALDVYQGEFEGPPPGALWSHPNVLITPHTSGMTDRPAGRNIEIFLTNLEHYVAGTPLENVIDWPRGY